jgi:hypothetical protein
MKQNSGKNLYWRQLATVLTIILACAAFSSLAVGADNVSKSLKAIHTAGQLGSGTTYSRKLCLGCHDREGLIKATENYGGREGFNPHSAHPVTLDCTQCHSVNKANILRCNECHLWKLPNGWVDPPIIKSIRK